MTAGGDWGKWIGGMGWGCVNLSSRAVSERVSLMSFNTAHLKGSGRIENACGGQAAAPRVCGLVADPTRRLQEHSQVLLSVCGPIWPLYAFWGWQLGNTSLS